MCQREAPAVAEVHEQYGNEITFVGVAGRDGIEPIVDFIERFDVGSFDHIVDESGAIWANFEIVSQPSFIFVDASGASTSYLGALGVGGMSERLDALLAQ